jgi:hypothetical protein
MFSGEDEANSVDEPLGNTGGNVPSLRERDGYARLSAALQ